MVSALNQAVAKEKVLNIGQDVVGSSPEELMATVKSDIARFGKVVKDAGILAE